MLTIYGSPMSRAGRVIWCAREIGLDFTIVDVDFMRGEHKQEPFLSINPMGQLPAIDDDGFVMAESLAINHYLAAKHGGDFGPQSPEEHGKVAQWALCAASAVEPHVMHVVANRMALPPEHRRDDLADDALARIAPVFGAIDRTVAQTGWLIGDRFTVADLNMAAVLGMLVAAGTDFSATPATERWIKACLARPEAADQAKPMHFPPPIVARYLAETGQA